MTTTPTPTTDLTVEELEALRTKNQERFGRLTKQGFAIDPMTLMQMQIQAVLEVLGDAAIHRWQSFFEKQMEALLDSAESQVNRARLLSATQAPLPAGGLVRP